MAADRAERTTTTPIVLLLVIAAGAAVIGGIAFYGFQKRTVREARIRELQSAAELKANSIGQWREGLLNDGAFFASAVNLAQLEQKLLRDSSSPEAWDGMERFARATLSSHGFRAIRLYPVIGEAAAAGTHAGDARYGAAVFMFPEEDAAEAGAFRELDLRGAGASIPDLGFLARVGGRAALPLRIPFSPPDGKAGLLILEVDPERYLFPLVTAWPSHCITTETLLTAIDGNDVLFLNAPRLNGVGAAEFRIPPGDSRRARDLFGTRGFSTGPDYRGIPVLAWTIPVEGSDWSVLVKMDEKEAFSPISNMGLMLIVAEIFFVLATATTSLLIWTRSQAKMQARLLRIELSRMSLRRRFEYLSRYANDAILLADDSLSICEANERAVELYGYEERELMGMPFSRIETEASPFSAEGTPLAGLVEKGFRFRTRHLRKDGVPIWVEVSARVLALEGKFYVQAIVRDISEEIRDREIIVQSMRDKEMLLRELHHRTKNNMQVVSSLLIMHGDAHEDPQIRYVFEDMVCRIRAMALVHEKLYRSENLSELDACTYFRELGTLVCSEYERPGIETTVLVPETPIAMDLELAVPCGLLVTELLSNAFKHAFPDGRSGTITIAFDRKGDGYELQVRDDGVGLPEHFDPRRSGKMGWQTIVALAETQIKGAIATSAGAAGGTSVTISFTETPRKG